MIDRAPSQLRVHASWPTTSITVLDGFQLVAGQTTAPD